MSVQISMIWMLLMVITLSAAKKCPDKHSCPDGATCCQLADESYACCPLKNAVCCDDHIHCCPESTKCAQGMCLKQNDVVYVKHLHLKVMNVTCPGGKYTCNDDSTCCETKVPGIYGCCPIHQAVCCKDGYHCCPEGLVCDIKGGECIGKKFTADFYSFNKLQTKSVPFELLHKSKKFTNIVCPGGQFQCPNNYTCCQLPSGQWGCCPFPRATCCSDHKHCCPENMQCVLSQFCKQGSDHVLALKTKFAEIVNGTIHCPDKTYCSDSMSCCPLDKRHYGCCIYRNGVCCSDHSHCCPNGYVCDVEERQCIKRK